MDVVSIAISAVGGLCCCVFWIAVIVGIIYFIRGRGGDELDQVAAPADKLEEKADTGPPEAPPIPAAVESAAVHEPNPDEMETVVASPPLAKTDDKAPKAVPPKPPEAKPPPRVSGATIIAFDDDDLE